MIKAKLTTLGNSTGVVFSKEMMEKLRVSKGDFIYFLDTPKGYSVTAYDDAFAKQMDVAEKIMREDRDILRKLAE